MSKKTGITPEDLEIFRRAVDGVKPLIHEKISLVSHVNKKTTPSQPPEEEKLRFNDNNEVTDVRGEEFVAYKQPAISNKTLRKLRKGQYNVEATLDLHGMSVEEAKQAVENFLQQCLNKRIRVALIIHGKGRHSQMPILKNKLNHWLRNINVILAFCSATAVHGSRGAIYVLLKRVAEENMLE